MLCWVVIIKWGGFVMFFICVFVVVFEGSNSWLFGLFVVLVSENNNVVQLDIVGKYVVCGINLDGMCYFGWVEIIVKDGMVMIWWIIGGEMFMGLGFFNGNILIIDWGEVELVVYQIGDDGVLCGMWSGGKVIDVLILVQ